jgi:alpha-glucosidase
VSGGGGAAGCDGDDHDTNTARAGPCPLSRGPASCGSGVRRRRTGNPTTVSVMLIRWTAGLASACLLICASSAEARTWTVRTGPVSASVRAAAGHLTVTGRRGGLRAFHARIPTSGESVARRRTVDERFMTPAGKRRRHELRARVLTVGRVDVLVARDGVAIRGGAPTFRAPAGSRAWLQRYTSNYENRYRRTDLRHVRGAYGFPALIESPQTWVLLSEAGFEAGHLRAHDGGLRLTRAARTWRFALMGDLKDIVGSSLPLALGRASRIADQSWIRPGRAAWSWWADSTSPERLETQQAYVDAAAARGWEYVLVDEGWDAAWIPELVRYAAARNVRILLWTHWRDLRNPRARARRLDRWSDWGVAGIKVDFLQSDHPRRIAVYDAIARAAARRRLVVNFHGCTVPRGLQRTWPNVLTMEAVLGAAHAKGGSVPAAHDVDLVFTRNVVGSMDYTPALTARGSTPGHQLAAAVAFESGIQHLADTPDAYAAHPAADQLLRALPVAWDDTRFLDGAPGSHATLARRAGDEWWIAALHAGPATERTITLDFLPPDRTYRATIVGDNVQSERSVTAADRLTVPVAHDGGFAVRLRP